MDKGYRHVSNWEIDEIFQNYPLNYMHGLKGLCLSGKVPMLIEETTKLIQLTGCAADFYTNKVLFDFQKDGSGSGYAMVSPVCWKEILPYLKAKLKP